MNTSIVIIFLTIVATSFTQEDGDPPTVDDVNLDFYYGRWINTHTTRFVLNTYQRDCFCATATYKICNETTLGVYNHQRLKEYNGPEDFIGGIAQTTDEPGKLDLFLDLVPSGTYWIMDLGPVRNYTVINETYEEEIREYYAYSLVGEPSRRNMFVLARDLEEFQAEFEAEALQFLDNNGFNGTFTSPIPIPQEPECEPYYADPNPFFSCEWNPPPPQF